MQLLMAWAQCSTCRHVCVCVCSSSWPGVQCTTRRRVCACAQLLLASHILHTCVYASVGVCVFARERAYCGRWCRQPQLVRAWLANHKHTSNFWQGLAQRSQRG